MIWLILALSTIVVGFFVWLKRVPHGWVQWRTGIVLKFLPPLDKGPVLSLRASLEAYVAKKKPGLAKSLPIAAHYDIDVPTRHGVMPSRVWLPIDPEHADYTHTILFIHGGGWCVGSSDMYEEVCRRLVLETGRPLISFDYGLAPESKFPIGHEQCTDGLEWLITAFRPQDEKPVDEVSLVGDSAGGNLVITTYMSSAAHIRSKVSAVVAIYPVTDSIGKTYPSLKDYANGYYLTQKSMQQFTDALIKSRKDLEDVRLSPIQYDFDHLELPRIFIQTADFDPLRDMGEAFAKKLAVRGHDVRLKRYQGTVHAFYGLKDFGQRGIDALVDSAAFIEGRSIEGLMTLEDQ